MISVPRPEATAGTTPADLPPQPSGVSGTGAAVHPVGDGALIDRLLRLRVVCQGLSTELIDTKLRLRRAEAELGALRGVAQVPDSCLEAGS